MGGAVAKKSEFWAGVPEKKGKIGAGVWRKKMGGVRGWTPGGRGSRPPCPPPHLWLGKRLHEIKISSDLRPIYDRTEWHTRPSSGLQPSRKDLRAEEDPATSCVTRKWNWHVLRPFLAVKSGHGTYQFQWRVGPSYCEYSGVTYNLLVSNIGWTYDLADQLPRNRDS